MKILTFRKIYYKINKMGNVLHEERTERCSIVDARNIALYAKLPYQQAGSDWKTDFDWVKNSYHKV